MIIRGSGSDERVIAWIVPNSSRATKKKLDDYLVTVEDLEEATGESIPVEDDLKHEKSPASWLVPIGCDKG